MRMFKHKKDWCHFCGKRQKLLLDICYSINSENDPEDESKYIRICDCCFFNGNQILQKLEISK